MKRILFLVCLLALCLHSVSAFLAPRLPFSARRATVERSTFRRPLEQPYDKDTVRHPPKSLKQRLFKRFTKRKLTGFVLGALLWWKGPIVLEQNKAYAVKPAVTRKADYTTKTTVPGNKRPIKIVAGASTIILAATAGTMVGQAVRKRRDEGENGTTSSSFPILMSDDDDDYEEAHPVEIEYAKVHLDEDYEKARLEKAQKMVEEVLENFNEAATSTIEAATDTQKVEVDVVDASNQKINSDDNSSTLTSPGSERKSEQAASTVGDPDPVPTASSRASRVTVPSFDFEIKMPSFIKSSDTASLPLNNHKYRKARQQPKLPEEEAELQEKYASIPSVEERAYQILVDLGMVEKH